MDRPPAPDRIADILAWIETRLDDPLTLALLAERAGLSPHHFSRLFTARMGQGRWRMSAGAGSCGRRSASPVSRT